MKYIATTKRHLGDCELPELITGTFTLTVFDIETAVVGMLNVTVSRCAAGLYADADGVCVECTKRLDGSRSGRTLANLPIKPGGFRFDESTEIVRDCLMGERACPGGNGTSDALCARGYEGPLCAVCSEGFILGRGNKCIECASSSAIESVSVPLAVLAVLFVLAVLAFVSDVLKPLFEYVWSTFGTQSRILWAFTQILAHIPILLSAILPATLRGFYLVLLKITDLNPFAAFGLSCANHALRSFETRLLFAVIAPVVVSSVLVFYYLVQVRVLGRDPGEERPRRHPRRPAKLTRASRSRSSMTPLTSARCTASTSTTTSEPTSTPTSSEVKSHSATEEDSYPSLELL